MPLTTGSSEDKDPALAKLASKDKCSKGRRFRFHLTTNPLTLFGR